MKLSLPLSDPLLKRCVLCEATLGVKLVDLYLRGTEGAQPAAQRLLCPDCDDLLHWRTKSRHRSPRSWERFGYVVDFGELCPVDGEYQIVEEIIRLRARKGLSYESIADWLNFNNMPSRRGGEWSVNAVMKIFEREAPNFGVGVDRTAISSSRYGYQFVDGETVKDEREQQVIAWILEARARKATYKAIALALNEKGIPTKRGRSWSIGQVANVIRSESALRGIRND